MALAETKEKIVPPAGTMPAGSGDQGKAFERVLADRDAARDKVTKLEARLDALEKRGGPSEQGGGKEKSKYWEDPEAAYLSHEEKLTSMATRMENEDSQRALDKSISQFEKSRGLKAIFKDREGFAQAMEEIARKEGWNPMRVTRVQREAIYGHMLSVHQEQMEELVVKGQSQGGFGGLPDGLAEGNTEPEKPTLSRADREAAANFGVSEEEYGEQLHTVGR